MFFTENKKQDNTEKNPLIDATLFQDLQNHFCISNNVYLYAVDAYGKNITTKDESFYQHPFVTSKINSLFENQLIEDLRTSSIESVKEINTGYDSVKMTGVAIWARGKLQLMWIVIGFLQDKIIEEFPFGELNTTTEEHYMKSIGFLEFLSQKLLAVKFDEFIAQEAVQGSIRSERELKDQLSRSQTFTSIIKQLESEKGFTDIVNEVVKEACMYLGITGGCLFQLKADGKHADMIAEYVLSPAFTRKEQYQNVPMEQLPFFNGKTYMISSDSPVPMNFISFFQSDGMKAAAFLPIEINNKPQMYLTFFEFSKKKYWEIEDVKFLNDVKRIIQTILQKRIAKNSLASSYASLEAILENVGCGIYVMNADTKEMLYSNHTFKEILKNTIRNNKLETIIEKIKEQKIEKYYHQVYLNEEKRWVDIHLSMIQWVDGKEVMLSTVFDVTEKMTYQQKIERQANNDFLTGLYNRMRCELDLENYINRSVANNQEGAFLYIDLDDFKHINDGLGHQYGDILLQSISKCLSQIVGEESSCYRMGGDEFVIIVQNQDMQKLDLVLNELDSISQKQWSLKGGDYYCTLSIGVVKFPADGNTVDEVIKKADIALYEAKRNGKNRVAFYNEEKSKNSYKRLDLEKNMRKATLDSCKEFEVYYQPIMKIERDNVVCCGAEALIRWNSNELGFISPVDFIPLAEYLGLINPIGDYVLKEAALACRKWNDLGYPEYKVNVNLSVIQLLQNDIVDKVKAVLEETRINPKNLTLEVTESLAIHDMERMKKILGEIKKLGVRVALDDFGTGYSSLNHIREMPIDVIKIDRCFIEKIDCDDFSDAFVKMVGELASTIGVDVCVEGIETTNQFEVLKDMKVNLLQGYLFGKPITLQQFEENFASTAL